MARKFDIAAISYFSSGLVYFTALVRVSPECQSSCARKLGCIIHSGNYVRVSMNVSKKGCSDYYTNTATVDPSSLGTTELHAFNDPYNSTYIGHQVQH